MYMCIASLRVNVSVWFHCVMAHVYLHGLWVMCMSIVYVLVLCLVFMFRDYVLC